jgi:PAS domain S-box-containing protein
MTLPSRVWGIPIRKQLQYYGFAVLSVAAATLLRDYLDPVLKDRFPYFLFYVALIASSWYGTLGSSLLCLLLGEMAADWFFVTPRETLGPTDLRSWEAFLTYVVVGTAITIFAEAHRRAATRSKITQSRLQLALSAANAGIFDWDIERNQIAWSPEYFSVLGLDRCGRNGPRTWMEHLCSEDRDRVASSVNRALEGGDTHLHLDFRTIGVDGKRRWVHARWMLYRGPSGRASRAVGVVLDVSELKEAELALVRSEKLSSAGRIAATMAHEINNPLEAVTNVVYLAQREPSIDVIHGYLQMADSELRWVSHVVQRTLSFYREDKPAAPFQVTEVLDQSLELVSRAAKAKSITITREYRDSVPLVVGVPGEIRQVFCNLLTNSLDAVGASGSIRIRVSCHAGEGSRQVRVSVADNGSGIQPSDLSRLYEPFFTTKKASGTGLGLWVSKQLIEKHGGRIQVHSSVRGPRTGTVFSLLLPAAASQERQAKTTERATSAA